MIELRPVAEFHGPNPLAQAPVVVVEVVVSDENQARLVGAIPAMRSASADWFQAADCDDALPPAQVLGEFLANWALQALTFVRGYLHAAGCAPEPGTGRVLAWVGFHESQLSLRALDLGARWLAALAGGQAATGNWPEVLNQLWFGCRQRHPDYQARIAMEASRRRDVPYAPAWGLERFWRYGQGERSRVLFESSSCGDGHFGVLVQGSKAMTKTMLHSLGLPAPPFRLVVNEDELAQAVAAVGFACTTKPLDRGGGKGVSTGLRDLAALRQGFAAAREYTDGPVMVEANVDGEEHRLMVVDGHLAAVIRREPPSVTGDGRRTIRDLVADKNIGRDARSPVRSGYRSPIVLDPSATLHLAGLGLHPDTVLAEGQTVRVRSNSNLHTGGVCVDVTEQIHPHLRVLAESLGRTVNLAMLGADYLTTDIGQSPAVSGGQFIEINTTPALDVMVAAGWSAERAGDVALGDLPARIPIDVVVVDEAALAVAIGIARTLAWPAGSGWATWGQAGNAGAELSVDAGVPWAGVQALLGHRTVARAVVIASDRQIYHHGLPLDACAAAHVACALAPVWLDVVQRGCTVLHRHDHRREDPASWLRALMESLR